MLFILIINVNYILRTKYSPWLQRKHIVGSFMDILNIAVEFLGLDIIMDIWPNLENNGITMIILYDCKNLKSNQEMHMFYIITKCQMNYRIISKSLPIKVCIASCVRFDILSAYVVYLQYLQAILYVLILHFLPSFNCKKQRQKTVNISYSLIETERMRC